MPLTTRTSVVEDKLLVVVCIHVFWGKLVVAPTEMVR